MKNNNLNGVRVSAHAEEGTNNRLDFDKKPQPKENRPRQGGTKEGRLQARPCNGTTAIVENEKRIPCRAGNTPRLLGMTAKVDAEALWKQVEDLVVPRLHLSVLDHVVYINLLRHSHLEGKRRLHFSMSWLARNVHIAIGTARESVRHLVELGALRIVERSKAGHVVLVRLPLEIRAVRAKAPSTPQTAGQPQVTGIEGLDFMKTRELRRAIDAREAGRCFYCLRLSSPRMKCLDHVVPRAQVGTCNSYRNLVSACMECNSQKGERSAEEHLQRLYRERRLTAVELSGRFHALDLLAAGNLKPKLPGIVESL